MPGLTLLDYQVFSQLCDRIEDSVTGGANPLEAFSEKVLGYGFEPDGAVLRFVLLCSPQAREALKRILQRALPEGHLQIENASLPVLVRDAVDLQSLQHAVSLPEVSPQPDHTRPSAEVLKEQVQVALGQSVRQVILQEHRKVLVPGYLLRFTPFTSPNLIILRIALGQIHYLHNAGRQMTDSYDSRSVQATMTEISRWSGLSRTSIYRLLHEDDRCAWLVDVDHRGSFQNDQGQQIALSNAYLLKPLPLTPGDAADLRTYLRAHQEDWPNMDAALESLARINRREIFHFPYRTPAEGDDPAPVSLQEIFRSVFGPFEPDPQLMALFDLARENLQGKDFVTLPWYVFRKLLPIYGSSIIMLYLMSLPLLFNHAGVKRDTFWLPGGADALAAWTGDKSTSKFFPKANAKGRGRPATKKGSTDRAWRQGKREMLEDFFLRVNTKRIKGQSSWQIQVHEPPILPADAQLLSGVYHLLTMLIREDRLADLADLFENPVFSDPGQSSGHILDRLYRIPLKARQRECLWQMADRIFSDFETPEDAEISDFETPADRLISLFETPEQPLFSRFATPARVLISYFETYLKILYRIKDSFELIDSNQQPDSQTGNSGPSNQHLHPGWTVGSLEKLLERSRQDYQETILQESLRRKHFKAWLIQGALNPRVQQPLSLAISKAVSGQSPPSGAASRLAETPITLLASVLKAMLVNPESMGYTGSEEQKQMEADLAQLLVGVDQNQQPLLLQRLLDILHQAGNDPLNRRDA
jgi:hypothetical protein